LSTDKASLSINAMEFLKRWKSSYSSVRNLGDKTVCLTRYGNVIARGSLIPLFKTNLGKSITITDPNMTRFDVIDEAVELVLFAFLNMAMLVIYPLLAKLQQGTIEEIWHKPLKRIV
jgi:FlaA1/EpsC-like NDP-sugar epimerase